MDEILAILERHPDWNVIVKPGPKWFRITLHRPGRGDEQSSFHEVCISKLQIGYAKSDIIKTMMHLAEITFMSQLERKPKSFLWCDDPSAPNPQNHPKGQAEHVTDLVRQRELHITQQESEVREGEQL
jgi:hypothetical protein